MVGHHDRFHDGLNHSQHASLVCCPYKKVGPGCTDHTSVGELGHSAVQVAGVKVAAVAGSRGAPVDIVAVAVGNRIVDCGNHALHMDVDCTLEAENGRPGRNTGRARGFQDSRRGLLDPGFAVLPLRLDLCNAVAVRTGDCLAQTIPGHCNMSWRP